MADPVPPTPSKPPVYQVKVTRHLVTHQERVLNVEAQTKDEALEAVRKGLTADNNPINDPTATEDWVDVTTVAGVTVA